MQDYPHRHKARKHPPESGRGLHTETGGQHQAVAAASVSCFHQLLRLVMHCLLSHMCFVSLKESVNVMLMKVFLIE